VTNENYLRGVQPADANGIVTSQIALPEATCKEVYATTGYEQSVSNLGQVSLARDKSSETTPGSTRSAPSPEASPMV
jgi:hypothetical protein